MYDVQTRPSICWINPSFAKYKVQKSPTIFLQLCVGAFLVGAASAFPRPYAQAPPPEGPLAFPRPGANGDYAAGIYKDEFSSLWSL